MHDQMVVAREAVGPNIDICADKASVVADAPTGQRVAMSWNLEHDVARSNRYRGNVEAYKKTMESTSTPICAGETII
jgi:galactonate dehydratase